MATCARELQHGGGSGSGRFAHCVTGVADHGTIDHGVTHHPIHDARGYKQIRGWLDRLGAYGGTHDVFLVLDLRVWPKRSDLAAQARAKDAPETLPRMSNESLAAMLTSLQPIRFQPYEEPAVCSGARSCLCKALAYPGWWEQVAKNAACMRLVREHEAATGRRYDWVTRLRSDYFSVSGDADRINAAEPVVHATRTSDKHVWIKGWTSPTCYDRSDWFALAPRQLADAYFDLASDNGGATCEWAETTKAQVHAKHTRVARFCPTLNERILVEWLVQKGTFVRNIHGEAVIQAACQLRSRCGAPTNVPWCSGRLPNATQPATLLLPSPPRFMPPRPPPQNMPRTRPVAGADGTGKVLVFLRTSTGLGDSIAGLSGAYWLSQWWGVPLQVCWPGAFVGRWKIPLAPARRCAAWMRHHRDTWIYTRGADGVGHACARCSQPKSEEEEDKIGLLQSEMYIGRGPSGSSPWRMYTWWRDEVILNVSSKMRSALSSKVKYVVYSAQYGMATNAFADPTGSPWREQLRSRFASPWEATRHAINEVLTLPQPGKGEVCLHQRKSIMPLTIATYLDCQCKAVWSVEYRSSAHGSSCTQDNCAVSCGSGKEEEKVRVFSDAFSRRRAIDYEKKNYTHRVDVYRTYQANMISGKVDGDEAAWLDMTTCGGAFWLPTSLFSLTAAVAAGADLHLEGRAPQSHRGLRAKNGTCAGFIRQTSETIEPPFGAYLGFP